MSPWLRIDSASPLTASPSNSLRGCLGFGWIWSTGRWASSGAALPTSTSKPRPRTPRCGLPALDKLHRHLPVRLGAAGAAVVVGHGEPVARRLRDAHRARHDGVEDEP